jgi:hypothetical protein
MSLRLYNTLTKRQEAFAPLDPAGRRVTFYMSDLQAVRVRDWADVIQAEMGLPPVREVPVWTLAASPRDEHHRRGSHDRRLRCRRSR